MEFVAQYPFLRTSHTFSTKKSRTEKKEKSRTGAAPVHKGGQRTASYEPLWCVQNRFWNTSPFKLTKLRACWWNFSTFRAEFSQGIATGLAIVFPLSAVIPYAYCEFFKARVAMIFASWFFLRLPLDWFSETSLPYFSIASKVIGQRQTKAHACTEHQII